MGWLILEPGIGIGVRVGLTWYVIFPVSGLVGLWTGEDACWDGVKLWHTGFGNTVVVIVRIIDLVVLGDLLPVNYRATCSCFGSVSTKVLGGTT